MTGGVDKFEIVAIRDFMAIDSEGYSIDQPLRLFVRQATIAGRTAHEEFACRDQHHIHMVGRVGWRNQNPNQE